MFKYYILIPHICLNGFIFTSTNRQSITDVACVSHIQVNRIIQAWLHAARIRALTRRKSRTGRQQASQDEPRR